MCDHEWLVQVITLFGRSLLMTGEQRTVREMERWEEGEEEGESGAVGQGEGERVVNISWWPMSQARRAVNSVRVRCMDHINQ